MVDPESREAAADGLLLVGRVARAHGLRGHVVVNPETDFMEDRFRTGRVLLVGPADRTREHEILESRIQQGRPIVRFAGIDTMSDAETLAGGGGSPPGRGTGAVPPRAAFPRGPPPWGARV